jgi:hypothetical protein
MSRERYSTDSAPGEFPKAPSDRIGATFASNGRLVRLLWQSMEGFCFEGGTRC